MNDKEILEDGLDDVIKNKILEMIRPDYWIGYGEIQDCMDNIGFVTDKKVIKKYLQKLKSEGKIFTSPVFCDDNLIRGKGWFLK